MPIGIRPPPCGPLRLCKPSVSRHHINRTRRQWYLEELLQRYKAVWWGSCVDHKNFVVWVIPLFLVFISALSGLVATLLVHIWRLKASLVCHRHRFRPLSTLPCQTQQRSSEIQGSTLHTTSHYSLYSSLPTGHPHNPRSTSAIWYRSRRSQASDHDQHRKDRSRS